MALSDPTAASLLPVLSAGPQVCDVCGTGLIAAPMCLQCRRARALLSHTADVVTSVALAVKGGDLAHELADYKQPGRTAFRRHLTAVLRRWLAGHEACLAEAAGVDAFDLVTVVPSLRARPEHPLAEVATAAFAERFVPILLPGAEADLPFGDRRFAVRPGARPDGAAVLLVDDTWTTGGHAQSAASALRLSGARSVAVLTLGRHFHPTPPAPYTAPARRYLARAQRQGWSWESCPLCHPRRASRSAPALPVAG